MAIMKRKQAEQELYDMWYNGEIPSNFTQEHSDYEYAVKCLMKYGYLIDELFTEN